MRPEPNLLVERHRVNAGPLGFSPPGASYGFFVVGPLRIISSGSCYANPGAEGWEHVSVSCIDRTPTWGEMQQVKELFWSDDETVIQFHPRKAAYVNAHPYCLHLWRRDGVEPELPPKGLIA